eukprot:SAG11_NODE_3986_length_2120_cov_2.716477_2_plen_336_part_00
MSARMSPTLNTGKRGGETGWHGELPSVFSSSSSPNRPQAVIDSRRHKILQELRRTEKRFPTLGLLGANDVQSRLDRLINRQRGATPVPLGEGGDQLSAQEFAQSWLTAAIQDAVQNASGLDNGSLQSAWAEAQALPKAAPADVADALAPRTEVSSTAGLSSDIFSEPRGPPGDPKLLCLVGGPGAGKSSVAGRVAAKNSFVHLSLGSMLRAAVASGHKDAGYIESCMKGGKLISNQLIMSILEHSIAGRVGPYVLDGFPRTVEQVSLMKKQFGDPLAVAFLDASESTMKARVQKRAKTRGSGKRVDDTEEAFTAIMEQFTSNIMPVMDYFDNNSS